MDLFSQCWFEIPFRSIISVTIVIVASCVALTSGFAGRMITFLIFMLLLPPIIYLLIEWSKNSVCVYVPESDAGKAYVVFFLTVLGIALTVKYLEGRFNNG